MMIRLTEYVRRLGESYNAAQRYAAGGRFKTAQKVGSIWYVDEVEPFPKRGNVKTGEYANWRKLHPIRNPGSRPRSVKGRPTLRVYALTGGRLVDGGLYVHDANALLFASYDLTDAQDQYYDTVTFEGYNPEQPVRLTGYRLKCEREDSAEQSYRKAIENNELTDSRIFYILDEGGEWTKKKRCEYKRE